jgi:DNA-binding IclR family transcriptional regulator
MSANDAGAWGSATASPAVLRAGALLDLVARAAPRPVGLPEAATELGIPRSSVANLLAALIELELVARTSRGVVLGHRLVELSGYYIASFDPAQRFTEYTRSHPDAQSMTMHLARLEGLETLNVARSYGPDVITVAPRIGQRLPANCTALGKAMLARLPDDEVLARLESHEPLPGLTPHSLTDVSAVLEDVRATRSRGFAINDEESHAGVFGMAVAVPLSGELVAVSSSALKAGLDDEAKARMLSVLREVALAVAGEMLSTG